MTGSLARVVGVPGAVLLGMGSILGTGIFVSIGIAAGVGGGLILPAVVLAAAVATCNGLSSAQLAASHPVSGGTYEYGYRYLHPALGFAAGFMFLCAKSASAATAALGLAGYLLSPFGVAEGAWHVVAALAGLALLTVPVVLGMRHGNRVNAWIVCATLAVLALFVFVGAPVALGRGLPAPSFRPGELPKLLEATALMFVAYTGYGRIATLGEEIRDPSRSIPRAIVTTLGVTLAVYLSVTAVAVGVLGPEELARETRETSAPLEAVAARLALPGLDKLVAAAAILAMAGVVLNLLLGLSRVLLAMARRRDVPGCLAHVDPASRSPRRAVLATAAIVGGLVCLGSVETTWSFSAFTVLVYYALTNLAALRLPASERRFPALVSLLGLVACLGLACWIDPEVLRGGAAVLAVGLAWHFVRRRPPG